ncbi:MAG TPA: maleylpyruvate isomerase family mycothiol-dependent enzyme [Acidimicrobiia bacterium]|nr:maleylpyruvate isomerase family mycothiol-dependent enzyme [Acidimicrobiia bacterium]
MLSVENLAAIRADGERVLELGRLDRERPVPQYPGWLIGDLVSHLGGNHARTTIICREFPTKRPSAPRPPEGADIIEWYEANLDEMLIALEESDLAAAAWGFWPESTIGLWEKRMVIETGLHRWDADQAFGEPAPLSALVARTALDEFGDMWVPRMGEITGVLEVTATDLGESWSFGSGAGKETASGTASDLYLRLMSRPSPVELPPQWSAAVDALEPPPKR